MSSCLLKYYVSFAVTISYLLVATTSPFLPFLQQTEKNPQTTDSGSPFQVVSCSNPGNILKPWHRLDLMEQTVSSVGIS